MEPEALEPEPEALERALGLAYRHLGRRARSVAEIRGHLEGKGVAPEVIDAAEAELEEQGYLDDAAFARAFAQDRRALDGWGAERIARRLREAGVARDAIDAALAEPGLGDELEAAVDLLRRRLGAPPDDDRARQRALGLLVRRGFELELAHDALRAFARAA